jgi:hypothetical protein
MRGQRVIVHALLDESVARKAIRPIRNSCRKWRDLVDASERSGYPILRSLTDRQI